MKKILAWLSGLALILAACAPMLSVSTADLNVDPAPPVEVDSPVNLPETTFVNPNSLEALKEKEFGLGELRIEYPWHNEPEFTRYYITYDSDDLNIHGFVNIPVGNGPFPVVIALHGYIPPSEYETLDYSSRYADAIARKGYIVLHPNMRNFPPSDSPGRRGDSGTGYTTDVMNLLEYVRQEVGQKGSIFENADVSRIGIWGHSLGGGVALRVISLVPEIKAAVLYAAVTQRYTNTSAGYPIIDLESSDAAYSVHHGTADPTVSVSWSTRFCEQLEEMGKEHECFFYEDAPHTFIRLGQDEPVFIQRTVDFFGRELKGEE